MRILYLGNNWVGWQVLKWLKEQDDEIVGFITHAPDKQRYISEMLQVNSLPPGKIFNGSELHKTEVIEAIKRLSPDIGLSVLFDYILKPDFLSLFPRGVVNLHPSYLPYNRGQYPNVWSIIEKTPSGVTLHYIADKIDAGDIIAQKKVPIAAVDTGETLYLKLERASVELFQETWPLIKAGKASHITQDIEAGTYHRKEDVETVDKIDLDQVYSAGDLINILRARSFPPYKGAYFVVNGKRVYMRLQLECDGDE